jgi:hypothetical protein
MHLIGIQNDFSSDRQNLLKAISYNNSAVMFLARADFQEAAKCCSISIKCIEERVFLMI